MHGITVEKKKLDHDILDYDIGQADMWLPTCEEPVASTLLA